VADALDRLGDARLVAVLRADSADSVAPAVAALGAGGVRAVELTFTTPGVEDALARVRAEQPELLLGAGTVRSPEQARAAAGAGAEFLVMPHLDPDLLDACSQTGLPVVPGAMTASEVAAALDGGARAVKLFPAGPLGVGYMRALAGPFPGVPFVPTGGIGLDDLADWLAAGAHAVGVGGELCSRELIGQGRFGELAELARRFVETAA
jgi:2-dehydro-3-deoxyphosphogluconate aldolase/(4S)-4-hydroxy-2-oxoglutarate aldolase